MTSLIYNYGLVEKCCEVKRDFWKLNFYKDKTIKAGLRSQCKSCTNENHYENKQKANSVKEKETQ